MQKNPPEGISVGLGDDEDMRGPGVAPAARARGTGRASPPARRYKWEIFLIGPDNTL